MKVKKILSLFIVLAMALTMFVIPVSADSIYTTATGWTLPVGDNSVQAEEQADGTLQLKNEAQFKPTLDSTKTYEITLDVTSLATGGSFWDQDFRIKLISGSNSADPIITHRISGNWVNDSTGGSVAEGTNGTVKIVINMATGAWETKIGDVQCMSGTIASTTGLTLVFYSWTDNKPYIGNVKVAEYTGDKLYTTANGWTLPTNDSGVQAEEQADGTLQLKNEAQFKPTLDSTKTYEITLDVTSLATGGSFWDQDFRIKLISGSNSADPIITHRISGNWVNDSTGGSVAEGTSGTVKIVVNMATGAWETKIGDVQCMSGTLASTTGLTLVFYSWTDNKPYIGNVKVAEYTGDKLYTTANGWTLPTNDSGVQAEEQADGTLQLKNEAQFKPTLDSTKTYEITYDVTGLKTDNSSGYWSNDFRVYLKGDTQVDIIVHSESGNWKGTTDESKVSGGDTTNKIIINMANGMWKTYVGDTACSSGTLESTTGLTLGFYSWTDNKPYIGNVKVAEYTGDPLVSFPQETALPNEDFEDKTNEWITTRNNSMYQYLDGEIKEETDGNKYLYLNSGDIYPTAFGDGTGKYKVTFKVKPGAYTADTDWGKASVALALGNGFADLRLGNSNVTDGTDVDVNWLELFGNSMSISEADGWIDIELLYDFDEKTVAGTATAGNTSVSGSNSLTVGDTGYVNSAQTSAKIWFSTTLVALCIDDLVAVEVGESKAPALTAESVKVYYGETEQKLTEVDPFADKIVVEFGQKMLETDLTADNIYVKDAQGNKIACSAVENDKKSYTMKFENGFADGTYTICIEKIKNIANVQTMQVYEFTFKVVGSIRAELVSIVQNGAEVETAAGLSAGDATINVKYRNTKDTTPVLHIIVAYYNADKLVKAEYVKQETNKGSDDVNCGVTYTVPSVTETYKEVQFMIWDGFDTMIPLSAPIILGE